MRRSDAPAVDRAGDPALLCDPSLWGVFAGNIVAIVLAQSQGWDIGEIMWIYWAQSVILGVINVWRILSLREFSTAGLTMNDQPVPETPEAKRSVATFFALHYGIFHLAYFGFLITQFSLAAVAPAQLFLMMLCALAFAGSHGFSFRHNRRTDFRQKKPNLGTLMFYPYLRIIPMHLTIVMGGAVFEGALLLFMVLKTLADCAMHMLEHHLFRKPDKERAILRD